MSHFLRLISCALLLCALTAVTGCQSLVEGFEQTFGADPPRMNTVNAKGARRLISPSTPQEDDFDILAEYGIGERDVNDLDDLDEDDDLGEVIVKLGEGIFPLENATIITGATTLVIEGEGPHKTRIELVNDDELRSLLVKGADRVVLRGFTVAGYRGGGLFFEDCPDVVVDNVHFVGSRFGIELRTSTATVGSSVFAGCAKGIGLRGGDVTVRETTFKRCYAGIAGSGDVQLESSAFVDNRTAVSAKLGRSSSIVSCVFAGKKQEPGWKGKPRVLEGNIANRIAFDKHFDVNSSNTMIKVMEDFPDHVRLPVGFDVAGVELALERFSARGQRNPEDDVETKAFEGAERYAKAAKIALLNNDLASGRAAARMAVRYWGTRPLSDGPDDLVSIAELGVK